MTPKKDIPTHRFVSVSELEDFLDQHHSRLPGLWIDHALKSSGLPSVNTYEARQIVLCFSWVAGFDTSGLIPGRRLARYTPRRERSRWSRWNKEQAQLMIDQGRMRPSGFAAIENAKANGEWWKEEGPIGAPTASKTKPQPKTKLESKANPKRKREQAEDTEESKKSKVKKAKAAELDNQKKTPLRRSLRKKS